jgi:hypothetical protein
LLRARSSGQRVAGGAARELPLQHLHLLEGGP